MFIWTYIETNAYPTYETSNEAGGSNYQSVLFTFGSDSPDEPCEGGATTNYSIESGYDDGFFAGVTQTAEGFGGCTRADAFNERGNTGGSTGETDLDVFGAGDMTGYGSNMSTFISFGGSVASSSQSHFDDQFFNVQINIDEHGTTSNFFGSGQRQDYGEGTFQTNSDGGGSFTSSFDSTQATTGVTMITNAVPVDIDLTVYSLDCEASTYIPIDSQEQGIELWTEYTSEINGSQTTGSQTSHQSFPKGVPYFFPLPFTDTDSSLVGIDTTVATTELRAFTGYHDLNLENSFSSTVTRMKTGGVNSGFCRDVFILNTDPFFGISPMPRVPVYTNTVFDFHELTTEDQEVVWLVTADDGDEGIITDLADSFDESFILFGSDYYELTVQEAVSYALGDYQATQTITDFTVTLVYTQTSDFAPSANQFSLPGNEQLDNPFDSDLGENIYTYGWISTFEDPVELGGYEYGNAITDTQMGFTWTETSVIFLTGLDDNNELSIRPTGGLPLPNRRHTTNIFNNSYPVFDTITVFVGPAVGQEINDPDVFLVSGPFSSEFNTVFEDGLYSESQQSFGITRTIMTAKSRNALAVGREIIGAVFSPTVTGGIAPFGLTNGGEIPGNRDVYCSIHGQAEGPIAQFLIGETDLQSCLSLVSAAEQQFQGIQGGISSLILEEHSQFHNFAPEFIFPHENLSAFKEALTYDVVDSNHAGATLQGSLKTTTDVDGDTKNTIVTGSIFIQLELLRDLDEISGITQTAEIFSGFLFGTTICGGYPGIDGPNTLYNMADSVVRFGTSNFGNNGSFSYSTILFDDRLDEIATDCIVIEAQGKFPYVQLYTDFSIAAGGLTWFVDHKYLTVDQDYNALDGDRVRVTVPQIGGQPLGIFLL